MKLACNSPQILQLLPVNIYFSPQEALLMLLNRVLHHLSISCWAHVTRSNGIEHIKKQRKEEWNGRVCIVFP